MLMHKKCSFRLSHQNVAAMLCAAGAFPSTRILQFSFSSFDGPAIYILQPRMCHLTDPKCTMIPPFVIRSKLPKVSTAGMTMCHMTTLPQHHGDVHPKKYHGVQSASCLHGTPVFNPCCTASGPTGRKPKEGKNKNVT